jgi:hypothetical protein
MGQAMLQSIVAVQGGGGSFVAVQGGSGGGGSSSSSGSSTVQAPLVNAFAVAASSLDRRVRR